MGTAQAGNTVHRSGSTLRRRPWMAGLASQALLGAEAMLARSQLQQCEQEQCAQHSPGPHGPAEGACAGLAGSHSSEVDVRASFPTSNCSSLHHS